MSSDHPPSGDTNRSLRHTRIGIWLNLLLLGLIAYGFLQSDRWRWAWLLVAIPIALVTLNYVRHLSGK
jgi:hypothetical protein